MFTFCIQAIVCFNALISTALAVDYAHLLPYNFIEKCKSTEYFDLNFFTCRECETTLGLQSSLNRLSCECDLTNATTVFDYDNEIHHPICNTSLVENSQHRPPECPVKDLVLIPSKSIQTQHVRIQTSYSFNCTECNTKTSITIHNLGQDYCVQRPLINDLLPFDSFRNTNPLFSHLAATTFFCQTMKDTLSCNRLANLCTLSEYSTDKLSPCSIFYSNSQEMLKDIDEKTFFEQLRPSLFYKRGKDSVDILDGILHQSYGTEKNGEKNKIQLIQTRYDVHGKFKTMQPLLANDLNPCASLSPSNAIHFGLNVEMSCRTSLLQMIRNAETYGAFLDIYLNYTTEVDKRIATYLVPVPMLVRGASDDNWSTDRTKWQLVNRVALVDAFSELTNPDSKLSMPSFTNIDDLKQFKTIRIVNHIELRVNLASDHRNKPNQIALPFLVVDHVLINTTNMRTSDDAELIHFTFKVMFTKSFGLSTVIQGILPVLLTLGILVVGLKTYRYKTRQQRLFYDVDIFGKFLLYSLGHTGDALFGSATLVCCYVLYVYRNQSSVQVVLPVEGQELLNVFVYVAVPLKIITVLLHLWRKCKADIFFVDWERPRTFDNHSVVKNNVETPSISSAGRKMIMYDGVSAWRSYFVANEWMKLVTKRRTSMRVQMVAVIGTVLIASGGCPELGSSMFQDATIRIATSFLLYLTVYLSQRVLFAAVFERYFSNTVQRFVDICSLANISLFVLELESFGYYVHGRSPHGFSDTDMCSMSVHLKREEQNTFGTRGLMLNSDQQTFTLLLSPNLRVLYDRLTASMLPPSNTTSFESHIERTAAAYYNINRFLNAFIDHGLKDLDYTIQDKTLVQRIFDYEDTSHCTENRGVFYSDGQSQSSFTNVLFYGNESSLFGMEIMVFVLIAGCWGNYLVGMLAVGAISRIMRIAFGRMHKTNLAHKTLIESRFLV